MSTVLASRWRLFLGLCVLALNVFVVAKSATSDAPDAAAAAAAAAAAGGTGGAIVTCLLYVLACYNWHLFFTSYNLQIVITLCDMICDKC